MKFKEYLCKYKPSNWLYLTREEKKAWVETEADGIVEEIELLENEINLLQNFLKTEGLLEKYKNWREKNEE